MKLQTLRQELETLTIKGNETIEEFISRTIEVANQIMTYGELILDQTVVAKVLRSLTFKFDYIVVAIKDSKVLTKLTADELSGSLQAHKATLNRLAGRSKEKAFQVKGDTCKGK